ncbi:MAG: ChbG/HpnK family deacetylase [Spirochaetota bacterium]
MSGIRLVTRADDAGMSAIANRAIREAADDGIVRNISLMAPAPAIRNAYELLGDLGGRVDFGLHVTLTAEWENLRWRPLTHGPATASFVRDDGTMHFLVDDISAGSPDLDAMMAEVEAQLDLLKNLGFTIGYIDEHMWVGEVPGLAERLAEFADAHELVNDRTMLQTGSLSPLPNWDGPGEHPGTELADRLAETPAGTYLLVGHPARKDGEMDQFRLPGHSSGKASVERNRQRRMFMDIEIIDYCENVGIELLRYSEL